MSCDNALASKRWMRPHGTRTPAPKGCNISVANDRLAQSVNTAADDAAINDLRVSFIYRFLSLLFYSAFIIKYYLLFFIRIGQRRLNSSLAKTLIQHQPYYYIVFIYFVKVFIQGWILIKGKITGVPCSYFWDLDNGISTLARYFQYEV